MVAKLYSMGLLGLQVFPVTIETDLARGLPAFDIVGLPGTAVKESRDRVRSAIRNCSFEFPLSRITVNMAPANQKKEGPLYDCALFLSLLLSSGQIDCNTDDAVFFGELSLSGELRPVTGILPMLLEAKKHGFTEAFIPAGNRGEGAVVHDLTVYAVSHVQELVAHLTGKQQLTPIQPIKQAEIPVYPQPDFADVKGQTAVKRALEIAAAGGHHVLMIGPPGTGKSMLAKRLPSILPDLTWEEMIETTKIYSIAGKLSEEQPLIPIRPFRAPHHTVSPAGLIGGGSNPKPGEASLAENGILFLDELPEFPRATTDVLRQPLEEKMVTISRASGTVSYPCSFTLIAAMNGCLCGNRGHPSRPCTCSQQAITRYMSHVSGPLLDRFDIQIEVPPVEFVQLTSTEPAESSAEIRKRVNEARAVQNERFAGSIVICNAGMTRDHLLSWCKMTDAAQNLLKLSFEKLGLSARAHDRILRVSRTIADLDHAEIIDVPHVAEAIQYRNIDRKYWQTEQP